MENASNSLGMSQAEMQVVLPFLLGRDLVLWPEMPTNNKLPEIGRKTYSVLETKVSAFYDRIPAAYNPYGKDWQAGIKNNWFKKDITLWDVAQLVKGNKYKEKTLQLRSIADKTTNRQFKQKYFSYATFSGIFERRDNDALVQHSQCICIDLDDLICIDEIKATIIREVDMEHFIYMFTSPNGNGLKILFHHPDIQRGNQHDYYIAFASYLADLCNLSERNIDRSCKDVSRACFLPHDPELFVNLTLAACL